MKAGLAAMIYGVRAFELAGPFAGEIHLCVLSDEEGCMSGAKALVKSGIINQVDGVVVCEPEGGEICIASKGAMRLRVRVRGQMAHGAMPKEGRNPIVGVGRLIAAMQKMEREFYIDHSQEGNMEELYLTPTVVRVGDERQMNVISEEGFLYLDVRTTPGIDHEQLIHNVGAVVDACGEAVGLSMDLEVIDDRPSVFTGKDSSLVRCLSEAYREVFGKAPALGTVPGTTDGTILARDLGLNVVVCGPGGKWIAHKVDEYVEVDEIVRYGRVFAECARRFLGLESV